MRENESIRLRVKTQMRGKVLKMERTTNLFYLNDEKQKEKRREQMQLFSGRWLHKFNCNFNGF